MLKLKLQSCGHLMRRAHSLEKTLMLGKIEGRRRRGRQGEMFGWHYQLDGHEFEQAPGAGDGQGGLACCGSWGHKESDTTEQLNNNNLTNLSDRKVPNFLRVRILRVQREIYRVKERKEKHCLKLSAITPGVPTGQVKAYQGTACFRAIKTLEND